VHGGVHGCGRYDDSGAGVTTDKWISESAALIQPECTWLLSESTAASLSCWGLICHNDLVRSGDAAQMQDIWDDWRGWEISSSDAAGGGGIGSRWEA